MGHHVTAGAISGQRRRRGLRARSGALALLTGAGVLVLIVGAALDIGHHAGVPGLATENLAVAGHLVTLAGMVLTATAVGLVGAVRRR